MKILIVDDDIVALEILKTALLSVGYEVETAHDGHAALARICRGDIRLVISDWEMPRMDGLELCQAVRRRATASYVYIILLTSHSSSQDIVAGMAAGADDFVTKPFNRAELMARVRAGQRVLSLESREMVIFALARLAESRDPDTGQHLERVQRYSLRLAETLAENPAFSDTIDADFIRLVYQTSPLHDIGKVAIPDAVLLKPGKLTEEEFELMKTHAAHGAETLEAAIAEFPQARFLRMARDIAGAHHERWDGTGYPQGLAGEEIPLAARIVAVADVYDALTSRRVYKDAFSHEVARELIAQDSGSHFDPAIVDAFLEIEEAFVQIRTQYADPSVMPPLEGPASREPQPV